jgi:hypothetical protein
LGKGNRSRDRQGFWSVTYLPDVRHQRIGELEAKVAWLMKPHVTEYQLAELPMGVPAGTWA